MRVQNMVRVLICLVLSMCGWIPATAQTSDSTLDRTGATAVPSRVLGPVDDEDFYAVPARPVLRRHLMLPASAPADPSQPRIKPKLRVATEARPDAVKTGIGIVYTCDPNVPASTCSYLNTTVAGYYNNIFTNANANIYIKFGTTGLGGSDGYINLVHYTPYVTDLTNKAVKSSIQASALSAINTYATPAYGTQNIMGISVSLGTALGFTGLIGINAAETASCTPYTSGCYNEVITVANAASQANGGFSFYYDDQGGTEAANQYDFYAVVQHETDEVLGTSSCISTQSSSGLSDGCDGPISGSNGIPSPVDLLRYLSPGKLALDTTPSTTAGQYYSIDGGVHYGIVGDGGSPKVYNTLDNGDDFADYISSFPDCGTNQAVQDAEGCPGEDAGLTILNDGQSELTILNTDGFDIPEAAISSPAPGSTLSGSSATFTWSAVSGATDYAITVGTTGVGSSNIYASPSGGPATSQAVTGLPTSGKIYVRVFSFVGGFWTSTDFTYTGGSGSSGPTISLSPAALTFASTTVGSTSAAQTVTVKNTGTSTVTLTSETITGTNATSFLKSATTCGTTLAAAASCTVSVEFKPAAAGALTASLSIADNATGSPQTVVLTGTGAAAQTFTVSFSPTSLAFASTTVGSTTAAQLVTVKNTGTGTVTLTSETITGTNATSFLKSATTCGTTLAAGASCTVSVEFKPAAAGALTGSLSVADNATGSPQAVALTGTGVAPLTVSLSPTSLAFASTTVGSTTAAQVVTVKNTGTAVVTLTSETITGTNATSFLKSATTCGTTLAAGASCTVSVEFKPAAAGALTGNLSVADNATGSPQTVALTGTGTAPLAVSLSPTSLAFASTTVGSTTAAQLVTVKNTGTATVTLTSETIAGTNATSFLKSATTCGTTLAAGASCTVSVEFKPAAAGALTASLSVADNATGSPQAVALTGTGTAAQTFTVSLSPASLAFASTVVGSTTAAQVVTVKNTGTGTVTLSSETTTGTNATSFLKSATTCGATLAAGASCTVSVEFKPTVTGSLTASLSVADNATGSPQTVALTGTGASSTPTVTLTPASIAFPNTITGTTSDAQVVTLKNTGAVTVTISSIALGGTNATSFLELGTCGTTLAAGASCSLYVAFKPASAAALTGTLSVTDTATGSPQKVTLTGTGTAAPSVKLSPTSIAFATTLHGTTSAAQAVTLTNSGTSTLTLTSISLTGTGAADFEALDTCGATLAASASCTVYVAFKPVAAGSFSASLTVADNGSTTSQSVTLTGTGN